MSPTTRVKAPGSTLKLFVSGGSHPLGEEVQRPQHQRYPFGWALYPLNLEKKGVHPVYVYGRDNRGRAEEIIGEGLALGEGRRDRVVLASKVYGNMTANPPVNEEAGISSYKIRKHLADSLKRLQADHLDLYQGRHIDRTIW